MNLVTVCALPLASIALIGAAQAAGTPANAELICYIEGGELTYRVGGLLASDADDPASFSFVAAPSLSVERGDEVIVSGVLSHEGTLHDGSRWILGADWRVLIGEPVQQDVHITIAGIDESGRTYRAEGTCEVLLAH